MEKKILDAVVYFPEGREINTEGDTYKWWNGQEDLPDDLDEETLKKKRQQGQKRKEFYEYAHSKEQQMSREEAAKAIRKYMDRLYEIAEKEDRDIVLFSDFITFDLGLTNALLDEHDLLPLYMYNDSSYPLECVDFTTWVKAKAGLLPLDSSNEAFKLLNIQRHKTTDSHNSLEDIRLLLKTVDNVMDNLLDIS